MLLRAATTWTVSPLECTRLIQAMVYLQTFQKVLMAFLLDLVEAVLVVGECNYSFLLTNLISTLGRMCLRRSIVGKRFKRRKGGAIPTFLNCPPRSEWRAEVRSKEHSGIAAVNHDLKPPWCAKSKENERVWRDITAWHIGRMARCCVNSIASFGFIVQIRAWSETTAILIESAQKFFLLE